MLTVTDILTAPKRALGGHAAIYTVCLIATYLLGEGGAQQSSVVIALMADSPQDAVSRAKERFSMVCTSQLGQPPDVIACAACFVGEPKLASEVPMLTIDMVAYEEEMAEEENGVKWMGADRDYDNEDEGGDGS